MACFRAQGALTSRADEHLFSEFFPDPRQSGRDLFAPSHMAAALGNSASEGANSPQRGGLKRGGSSAIG